MAADLRETQRKPGFPWGSVLLLAPAVLLLVLVLLVLSLLAPGASTLAAFDCLSDASCVTPTGGPGYGGTHLNEGASAYVLGVLFAFLACVSSWLVVSRLWNWLRPVHPSRSRLVEQGIVSFAYLLLDTVALWWLLGSI